MKKFIEKIKDIVYDSFDYIVMLGIVVLVVGIIGWRLDVLFAKDVDEEVAGKPVVIDVDRPRQEDNTEFDDEKDIVEPDEEPTGEEQPETSVEQPADKPTTPATTPGEIVKINIPAGSLPGKIGLILQENGLIDSSKAFIAKAVELKLDTKLKSGTFSIAKGSSYEEILKIITK